MIRFFRHKKNTFFGKIKEDDFFFSSVTVKVLLTMNLPTNRIKVTMRLVD